MLRFWVIMNCGGTLFNLLQASFGQQGWEPQASVKPGSWGGALGVMIRGPRRCAGACFLRWEWVSVCLRGKNWQTEGGTEPGGSLSPPPHPATHTRTQPHTHVYTHTQPHMYTHVHTCVCTCTHNHTCTHIHADTHVHIYTYTHVHIYPHVHTYTRTCTHTHTLRHTGHCHFPFRPRWPGPPSCCPWRLLPGPSE